MSALSYCIGTEYIKLHMDNLQQITPFSKEHWKPFDKQDKT